MSVTARKTARSRLAFTGSVGLGLWLALMPASHAALTINNTRVVFDSDKRSVAVIVANPGDKTYAVQTWVNTAADDTLTAVPFIASPPLFRLGPGQEQQVQINGLPQNLPRDRESLYYFNVQEIPQVDTTGRNVLNIALRTRIKLFYRPVEIKHQQLAHLKDLQWSIREVAGKRQLWLNNASPFHVTFASMNLAAAGKTVDLKTLGMAEPLSEQGFDLEGFAPAPGLLVTFTTINDYGGLTQPVTTSVRLAP